MITKAALLEDLDRAGIDPHGMLLCHFSMKKIGPVENGADTVLDALMEYMKNGLLIVPCHTWSNVNDENPVFDVRETKPCVGLLPDLFRRRKGVVRTLHPTHSLCVYGPRAQAFAEGQERFDTPCAPGSCYGELLRQNAQVMMVGVTFACNTSVHCIEEIANVPGRLTAEHHPLFVRDQSGRLLSVPSRRHQNANSDHHVKLEYLQVTSGKGLRPIASVGLDIAGEKFEAASRGNGPVDAAINALKIIIRRQMVIKEFTIQNITKGSDDVGKVHMQVEHDGHVYYGFGADTDIVTASVEAFIDCINKFRG